MDFLLSHWGNLASVIGVVVSVAGLAWAVIEARRARSAAQAAEQATLETKDNIAHHLLVIDLERAIGLIQRLKSLHRDGRWEVALEQYQVLRAMISAIARQCPASETELRERLSKATVSISEMELQVEAWVVYRSQPIDIVELNQELNDIQSDLEDMSNTMELGG